MVSKLQIKPAVNGHTSAYLKVCAIPQNRERRLMAMGLFTAGGLLSADSVRNVCGSVT